MASQTAPTLHGMPSKGCRQYPGRRWAFSGGWWICNLAIFHSTYEKQEKKKIRQGDYSDEGVLRVTDIEEVRSHAKA